MEDLQEVQQYLNDREATCQYSHLTIFDNPTTDHCFATRFFDRSPMLQARLSDINEAAATARQEKENEWRKKSDEYEHLQTQISKQTCVYLRTEDHEIIHDNTHCTKCFLQRQCRRMRIDVYEHPLPSDPTQMKAAVFELNCPTAYERYRSTTWDLLYELATISRSIPQEPRKLLTDFTPLKPFTFLGSKFGQITLASRTKPFQDTHYGGLRFPVELSSVCTPNGLTLRYYDTSNRAWVNHQPMRSSFAHHVRMPLRGTSPFATLQEPADSGRDLLVRTSYQIVANQPQCPAGLNIHEFNSYQALMNGRECLWLAVLTELASENLNFSTEPIVLLVVKLANMAGLPHENDPLRKSHRLFRDGTFVERLIEQLNHRLDGISSNYREGKAMEMILSLTLRLNGLISAGLKQSVDKARKLLSKVRDITFRWIVGLRSEIMQSKSIDASRKHQSYIVWAAMLFRRTFLVYLRDNTMLLPLREFSRWIEASIIFHENLPSDPASLPVQSRNALIRDLKLVYQLRDVLHNSLVDCSSAFPQAVNAILCTTPNQPAELSDIAFLPDDDGWIQCHLFATQHTIEQRIHYNYLGGCLLIGGQQIGKISAEHRDSVILQELFPDQNLLTWTSNMPGMTYRIAQPINHHEVHVGQRDGRVFVRAINRGCRLEFVHSQTFGRGITSDLPSELVENCIHWLNLETGVIEIRRKPAIWKSKDSNWQLDVVNRLARRRGSTLVDPHSYRALPIRRTFAHFELPEHLTMYQPLKGSLVVDLPRVELRFTINNSGLLQCRQLHSEVDPNQDPGVWVGLESKIVLRQVANPTHRSIIVPLGVPVVHRNGQHVSVNIPPTGIYARYNINETLRRLDCPPEPRLIYTKALLHAYTSFPIPDSLTGRTGVEEALHCLQAKASQPWTPLANSATTILADMASRLTTRRVFYPANLKVTQKVTFNPDLHWSTQHEDFLPLIEAILTTSRHLSVFSSGPPGTPQLESLCDDHLLKRARTRRAKHERDKTIEASDSHYHSRAACRGGSTKRDNVFEVATLLNAWTQKINTPLSLNDYLHNWPVIGGFDRDFDCVLLSELMELRFDLQWGSLVRSCLKLESDERFYLLFPLSLAAYANDAPMELIRALISIATSPETEMQETLPDWPLYNEYRYGFTPTTQHFISLIEGCAVPYEYPEFVSSGIPLNPKLRRKLAAAKAQHDKQAQNDCQKLIVSLIHQWPCPQPSMESLEEGLLIDLENALRILRSEWERCYQNMQLSQVIDELHDKILNPRHTDEATLVPPLFMPETTEIAQMKTSWSAPLSQILSKRSVKPVDEESKSAQVSHKQTAPQLVMALQPQKKPRIPPTPTPEITELDGIIKDLQSSGSTIEERYAIDLANSLKALKSRKLDQHSSPAPLELPGKVQLQRDLTRAKKDRSDAFAALFQPLEDARSKWLQASNLWPALTPTSVLEQLRSTSRVVFHPQTQNYLIAYATATTKLQQLLRLDDALRKEDQQKIQEENSNRTQNYVPSHYPDWILLEIEADILIRPNQVKIALATISPSGSVNSVNQLQMGQGKTSTIIPMVSAILANSDALARIIVPDALLLQTTQILQSRLGGLIGRAVRHVPFSRKTATDAETVRLFMQLHEEIRQTSGVMVCLPGHILSFQLSGQQRLLDGQISEASTLIRAQQIMNKRCRDVLDECDSLLAVKTQLIYPSGTQMAVDGHPHRWEVGEALLQLVSSHVLTLQKQYPNSLEVRQSENGRFPLLYFLRQDAEDALINLLVKDTLKDRVPLLHIDHLSVAHKHIVKHFIAEPTVSKDQLSKVNSLYKGKEVARQCLYLIRGLLVHRTLLLCLKKRFNVQYGLHPERAPLAVPYHSKGTPSDQSEWGHPDVAIIFTVLSFYYGGLQPAQLRQALSDVAKSQDASGVYERFIHGSESLPHHLRDWHSLNIEDDNQFTDIWNHLRHKPAVCDYFLNHFVFPKHAKQFKTKLQTSGWDIPLLPARSLTALESRKDCSKSMTTGFSGTNDNKTLLPMTIRQADLPELAHTNAEVLSYLLQSRNRQYVRIADVQGRHLSEIGLLNKLQQMKIRILIDAGAQILELDNKSLVEEWLRVDYEIPAAVYFAGDNKPMVVYRGGRLRMPLAASPYAENMEDCLVYLDQAHTRGTDLKLPRSAKGALTLGLDQTKDATVQAAMRLRHLATTQSVVFFAPPEVHQSILDVRKSRSGEIDSHDVVCWLLEQTCQNIESLHPLFYAQGVDFCRRNQAVFDHPEYLNNEEHRNAYVQCIQREELQTIQTMYTPKTRNSRQMGPAVRFAQGLEFMKELNRLRKDFQDTGKAVHASALGEMEVEQEREVAREVELVREVQKPPIFKALQFPGLSRDLEKFIETGRLMPDAEGYLHAFVALQRTALGEKRGIRIDNLKSGFFVSREFTRTIKLETGRPNDNFLRAVNFMLISTVANAAVAIIPEEAELAIPMLRNQQHQSPTHLVLYAAPLTKNMMLHFNDLKFYTLPALPVDWQAPTWLKIQLGILAGRLYFSLEEYEDLMKFLGTRSSANQPTEAQNLAIELHDSSLPDLEAHKKSLFTDDPLTFIQEWLSIRRKGQDFAHSPMGHVCRGKLLTPDHHFFARVEERPEVEESTSGTLTGLIKGTAVENDEDSDSDSSDDEFFDVEEDNALEAEEEAATNRYEVIADTADAGLQDSGSSDDGSGGSSSNSGVHLHLNPSKGR